MLIAEFGTGQVFWSIVWFALFALWFGLVVAIFGDITRSRTLSGWDKAVWTMGIILLPYLGVLLYMIVNTDGQSPNSFDRDALPFAPEPEELRSLVATGAITPDEYQRALEKHRAEAATKGGPTS